MDAFLNLYFASPVEQDQVYKALLFIVRLTPFCLRGCMERYFPDKDRVRSGELVIIGHLTSKAGKQPIQISHSVSIRNSTYQPVWGYYAEVERLDGEARVFSEDETGSYQANLDEGFLLTGHDYRLQELSPEGRSYESSFERMFPAPVIDAVWFELEETFEIHNPKYIPRMLGTDRRFHDVTASMKTLDCRITRGKGSTDEKPSYW